MEKYQLVLKEKSEQKIRDIKQELVKLCGNGYIVDLFEELIQETNKYEKFKKLEKQTKTLDCGINGFLFENSEGEYIYPRITTTKFYEQYLKFCEENGISDIVSRSKFSTTMNRFYKRKRVHGGTAFIDVRLKNPIN